jgi:prepilin-type N-terminal cleavage/methylation domain-containing protein
MMRPTHRHGGRRRRRGFTLIEVTVAMAIGLAAVYAGAICVVQLKRLLISAEKSAEADANAKLAVDGLVSSYQGIGGYALRPWSSIYLEQGWEAGNADMPNWHCDAIGPGIPSCSNTDRLSVVQHFSEPPPVSVTEANWTGLAGELQGPTTCGAGGATCCFTQDTAGNAVDYTDITHQTAMLISDDGAVRVPARVTAVNGGACTLQYAVPTDAYGNVWQRRFRQGDFVTSTVGTLVLVRFNMFFLSSSGDHLIQWWDRNANGNLEGGEATYFVINTRDIQFAIGFDLDGDGRVTDTGSTTDEYYGNAANDRLDTNKYPFAVAAADRPPMDTMRTVQSAIVVFNPSTYADEAIPRVLDGQVWAPEPGKVFRASAGVAFLRNLNIYTQ